MSKEKINNQLEELDKLLNEKRVLNETDILKVSIQAIQKIINILKEINN